MDKTETKKVYAFDSVGKYLGERLLDWTDRSPISGRWQIPAGCTEEVVNEVKEGYSRIFDGKAWKYVKEEEKKAEEVKPSEPTADDKINALDAKYDADKEKVSKAYLYAQMYGDTDQIAKIRADLKALDDQYDAEYEALESEDEDDE